MLLKHCFNFTSSQVLDESGVGNLYTLCHGDAKPNNFMFRKITLDFGDDEEGSLDMDPALQATDKDLEAMSLLTRELSLLIGWSFGLTLF